jgi:FAD/FMN-containing dehydrogenase
MRGPRRLPRIAVRDIPGRWLNTINDGALRAKAMPLFDRLKTALQGDVLASRFDRGRYATDASFYQIMPAGVVLPKSAADLQATLAIARDEGVTVTARGGGTSQSGQTVGSGLIADCSRHFNRLLSVDEAAQTCVVEPGIVLDELNRQLRPKGLWFPIDVSTASRATIGGMAGNNTGCWPSMRCCRAARRSASMPKQQRRLPPTSPRRRAT